MNTENELAKAISVLTTSIQSNSRLDGQPRLHEGIRIERELKNFADAIIKLASEKKISTQKP